MTRRAYSVCLKEEYGVNLGLILFFSKVDFLNNFACQEFEFEKSAHSFDSVVNFLPSLCYFAADCMVEWPKLCIGHEVNYPIKFSCGIKFS